ncbi:hypothetical protein Tco_1062558 [Tanacetum coccineum]
MKDLGEAAYILRIKIIRDRLKRLIALSQSAYTPMMEKPDYRKSQGAKTPSEAQRLQRVPYALVIGSIMYAVRYTRPDVAFAYGSCVWGKPEAELKVSCYADATVDWKSAKQSITAMSSIEAEYIAATEASMEAIWIRKFIDGLGGVVPLNKRPMEMLCDNEPAIAITNDFQREPYIFKGNITTFMK